MSVFARARGLGVALAVVSAALLPIAGTAAPACASSRDHAALVIDTGSQSVEYCVALTSSSVSGIELIKLASSQYGLQYSLGFGSKAVCQLAGVGVSGGDCFSDFPNFWGYWHGTGSGGWSWASTGAADTSVQAGDIEGWSWGKGSDASSHHAPPSRTYEEVCAGVDSGSGNSDGGGSGSGAGGSGDGSGGGVGGEDTGGSGSTSGGSGHHAQSESDTPTAGRDSTTADQREHPHQDSTADSASDQGSGGVGQNSSARTATSSGTERGTDPLSVPTPVIASPAGLALAAGAEAGSPGGISGSTVLALAAILILTGAGATVASRRTRSAGRHGPKG